METLIQRAAAKAQGLAMRVSGDRYMSAEDRIKLRREMEELVMLITKINAIYGGVDDRGREHIDP